ncbi:MAG: hypothetical protein M3R38_19295 [Actinomycetota bacterium]|nr:hypothetical protein [Actinomycetota bacterium]MDP9477798.1 hypothetical protein [Actinomycetota bacterium]
MSGSGSQGAPANDPGPWIRGKFLSQDTHSLRRRKVGEQQQVGYEPGGAHTAAQTPLLGDNPSAKLRVQRLIVLDRLKSGQ